MSSGTISAIRGIVIEMHFENDIPKIYDAVKTTQKNADGSEEVIEILQQLENGYVKGIAMTSTDGLKRGDDVINT